MRSHSRKLWPALVVLAVMFVAGLLVLHGIARGVVAAVAMLAFLGTCIYGLAGESVSDGAGGIGGPLS
jgi:Na+/H+-translocating membrane pyrophosphatase